MTNANSITTTAATIAAQLGETDSAPRATIWRAVRTLGPERAQAFVTQALEAEANGGMMVPDRSRKRTLGGIFFYLVRTQVSDDEAMRINRAWRWQQWKQRQPAKPKAAPLATDPRSYIFTLFGRRTPLQTSKLPRVFAPIDDHACVITRYVD